MAKFTLVVSSRTFDPDEARADVDVLLTTTPKRYPVPGVGILETVKGEKTNAEGVAEFDLIALPGLYYKVTVGDSTPITISGAREDGEVVRLDMETSVAPSPITSVDAAALEAKFTGMIEAIELDSSTVYNDGPIYADLATEVAARQAGDSTEAAARQAGDAALQLALDALDPDVEWDSILGKPATFPPATHTHDQYATDTDLATGLAGKAPTVHTHDQYATDAELATGLAGKAALTHLHTAADVTDFVEAAQDAVAAMLGSGSNVVLNYNDATNSLSIGAVGDGTGLDAEAVRDAIGVAMVGIGNVSVVVNDAADTITISTTATANATDAFLTNRANHTGEQAISTVTGLQATLDGKAPSGHLHDDRYYTETETDALLGAKATTASLAAHTGNMANPHAVTKAQVGLGSVDNTSDASKPVSTATQTALDGKAATAHDHDSRYYTETEADALLAARAPVRAGINAQTGTTFAPALSDENKLVTITNAGAITVTLPSDATTAFPIGARIDFEPRGVGMITYVAGAGATANGSPSLVTRARYTPTSAIKVAANTWDVWGDLA